MFLSVIVPVYNEADNIKPMISSLQTTLVGLDYEIIFIDDGSKDQTINQIINSNAENVSVICFSRNFGQTSALAAGIDAAKGQYIVTLDGDLQNDPSDIPLMLNKLIEGDYDIVAGRRAQRNDNHLRKIPSKIANYIIRKLTKTEIKDLGCTLKVFKADLAKKLDLYGELHRFIPVLASFYGARIAEIDVKHHPRIFGESKYGINRTIKVLSDTLLMYFFQKYRQKPMHLFGSIGIIMFSVGALIESYLLVLKIFGSSIGTRPLFYIGILLIITSVQLITTGFLAELIMRTYFSAQNSKPYSIKCVYKANDIKNHN